jgi:ribosomal-protein-serine acetyltransferase
MQFKHPLPGTAGDIHLRPLQYHQADQLFQAVDRNRDHLKPWVTWVDRIEEVKHTRKYMKYAFKGMGKGKEYQLTLWDADTCIGGVSFKTIDKNKRTGELFYWIDKDYTGQGIVTAAVKQLIHFGFETLKLAKVTIKVVDGNDASRAVAERLNFNQDGTLRDETMRDGEIYDLHVYSMLANEWTDQRQQAVAA